MNQDKGTLKEFTVQLEGLTPWALQAFLDLVTQAAGKHGLSTIDAAVSVDVTLEGFSGEADLEGFRAALGKQWCFAAAREARE